MVGASFYLASELFYTLVDYCYITSIMGNVEGLAVYHVYF